MTFAHKLANSVVNVLDVSPDTAVTIIVVIAWFIFMAVIFLVSELCRQMAHQAVIKELQDAQRNAEIKLDRLTTTDVKTSGILQKTSREVLRKNILNEYLGTLRK